MARDTYLHLGGLAVSNIFYCFTPTWKNDPILTTNMFQGGWFNHQPVHGYHGWLLLYGK